MAKEAIKCPQCDEPLERVRVYSETYQYATVEGDQIVDYGGVEELTETIAIECNNCNHDVIDILKQ